MPSKLKDNINSRYFEAANALTSRTARRRIVAYVESYDDIYFWRTVLNDFETPERYFEVMLPSKVNLTRGKKSVLMNFLEDNRLGSDMIACVDADYDYLLQRATHQSCRVLDEQYVFHTYVYAIENYQCYAPSLHNVCVAVTLNDHRIFNFEQYLADFSEALFPLFVWSIMLYRNGNYPRFTITDLNRIADPGGFNVQNPGPSIMNIRRKVGTKIRDLQRQFPDAKEEYLKTKDDLKRLGITPQTTYLYIQGHHLFDNVVAPILSKVCNLLRQERQQEIYQASAHRVQKRNEMSCYENSLQDVKTMLKKNNGFVKSEPYQRLQSDIQKFLNSSLLT
ncbi:MAG: DUF4435 domain-containing protein, partial [Bacteroidaceae bacterium]|nr:DUF4435 domain-containing protein [Bacteroidaceae bacterium]